MNRIKKITATAATTLIVATSLSLSCSAYYFDIPENDDSFYESQQMNWFSAGSACKLEEFYFYDYETGLKENALLNENPNYSSTGFQALFAGALEHRDIVGDKLVWRIKVTDEKSKYYGQTFSFEYGNEQCPISYPEMYETTNTYFQLLKNVVFSSEEDWLTFGNPIDANLDAFLEFEKTIVYSDAKYNIVPSAVFIDSNKNALKCTANASYGAINYISDGCADDVDVTGNQGVVNWIKRDDEACIAVKVGDEIELTPYIQFANGDSIVSIGGEEISPLHKFYSNAGGVITAISTKDDYAVSVENETVLSVGGGTGATPVVTVTALSEGETMLKVSHQLMLNISDYDTVPFSAEERAVFESLFPYMNGKSSNDMTGVSVEGGDSVNGCAIELTFYYQIKVYPENKEVELFIEETPINELNGVFDDCDFSVVANTDIDVNAQIDGHPYSYAFDAEYISIGQTNNHSGTVHKGASLEMNQNVQFISARTQIVTIDFDGEEKKVKILPTNSLYDKFIASYQSKAEEYLNEPMFICTNDTVSLASYITDMMKEVSGNDRYGIPLFPTEKSISVDNFDSSYIENLSFDKIRGLKETLETYVIVSIGIDKDKREIIEIPIIISNAPPEFMVIPASAADYSELKKMSYEEIKKLSISLDEPYILYNSSSLNFYAFQYPMFTKGIDVEVKYGTSIATVTKDGIVAHKYTVTSAGITGNATIRLYNKDRKEEEHFPIKVTRIESVGLDPNLINYTFSLQNNVDTLLAAAQGQDLTNLEVQQNLLSLANSGYESKNVTITPYVDNQKYTGTMYYVLHGNTQKDLDSNGNVTGITEFVTSDNWEKYANGIAETSDVYACEGTLKLNIKGKTAKVMIYAFPYPPDLSKPFKELTADKSIYAECIINVSGGTVSELSTNEETVNYEMAAQTVEAFKGYTPVYDADGALSYYYKYEITPEEEEIEIEIFDTENILIKYEESCLVPFKINDFSGSKIVTNAGSFSLGNKKLHAIEAVDKSTRASVIIYLKDNGLFDVSLSQGKITLRDGTTYGFDGFSGIDLYAYVDCELPYTTYGTVLKSGTIESNGNSIQYRTTDGDVYSKNLVKFAIVGKSASDAEAIKVTDCRYDNGKIKLTGKTETGRMQEIIYNGQEVYFAVSDEIKIECPDSERFFVPYAKSNNASVATADVNMMNTFQLNATHSAFSVDITAEDYGECLVNAFGTMTSTCSIKVKVPDYDDEREEEAAYSEISYTNGFEYSLKIDSNQYTMSAGETIQIPLTATAKGTHPTRGKIEPYEDVEAYISNGNGHCEATLEDKVISVKAFAPGNYTISVLGFDGRCRIYVKIIVK